jgi:drug/metabolite transporter (DMT)-like permease
MKSKQLTGTLILLLTALIWGCAFVAQSEGAKLVEPFTFNSIRFIIGGLVLLPVIAIVDFNKKRNGTYSKPTSSENKLLWFGGAGCGLILSVATSFQQIGLDKGTEPGKAGFITALYILLVPIVGLFLGRRIQKHIWICVLFGIVGLYLLCVESGTNIALSDIYVLLCAVTFTFHILLVDYLSPRVDALKLSFVQFIVSGIVTAIPMLLFESPDITSVFAAKWSILYTGVLSCGVGYTLQIVGQKYTSPTIASLVMSFESVFAVLAGMFLPGGMLSLKEAIGCVIMFAAIILAQIPAKNIKSSKKGLSQKLKIKLRLSLLLCNFARFGKTKEKSLEMRQK